MRRIGVWFDGGGAHGYGNIRRSRELGEALAVRGYDVSLVPLSSAASALSKPSPDVDLSCDVIVVDAPHGAENALARARVTGAKTIALDYEGVIAPDMIISLRQPSRAPSCAVLWGSDFAIIRREIRNSRATSAPSGEVAVLVGGGDVNGMAARIAEKLRGIPLCLVQGPAGPRLNIQAENVRVLHDPPDLPQVMARCKWAVTTGGTTMLEFLCLGKAVHVVPRTPSEVLFADTFAQRGALLGVGLDCLNSPGESDLRRCEAMGPQLIDGRGCDRIIAAVESLL